MVCYTDALNTAPVVLLGCGHVSQLISDRLFIIIVLPHSSEWDGQEESFLIFVCAQFVNNGWS